MRRFITALLLVGAALAGVSPSAAQGLDQEIAAVVIDRGWWDETASLDAERMDALVAEYDGAFAFAYTDRSFDVNDSQVRAAAILAQAVLDAADGSGIGTVVLLEGSDVGGASTDHPYSSVVLAFDAIDRGDPEGSFAAIAAALSTNAQPADGSFEDVSESAPTGSTFTFGRVLVLVLIVLAIAILWMAYSTRRKSVRTASTADARDDTSAQLTAMSDLILELEPRITIADDADLKQRYVAAAKTYAAVMERAESVTGGHEVADLRIEIAKARWRLDVIEAELDGSTPPPEPHSWDAPGSAWDSTRGTGAGPH